MRILRKNNEDINLSLNQETNFKTDLGWSDSFQEFEKQSLEKIINVVENYETVRYIHKPYSGITDFSGDTQSDIWFYFYFLSGSTYVQNYETTGLTNKENAGMLKQSTKSFFRLEFYKTPNDEPPTRANRRMVFSKNLSLPLGEKFFYTGQDFNDYVHIPVFMGSNYKNKENMYIFWFQDESAFNETTLTGNTFWMTAKYFNAKDGTIIDFTNKDLSIDNSGIITERRGLIDAPIKFYEKGIPNGDIINETLDLYYKVTIDKTDYSYIVYFDLNIIPPTPSPSPSVTPTITSTPSITPSITPRISITPSVTPTITLTPSITPSITLSVSITPTVTLTPSVTLSITPSISISPTITPSKTPSVTPSTSKIYYYYNATEYQCDSCINLGSQVVRSSTPLSSGNYYADTNYLLIGSSTSGPSFTTDLDGATGPYGSCGPC